MRIRAIAVTAIAALAVAGASPALADAARPGQSMTHMKTAAGLVSKLEGAGVVLYVQGGATSAVMGDSIAAANGQVVFHIPVTKSKSNVEHVGSNIVFFNTTNDQQVQLRNPVISLKKGVVIATVPQASERPMTVLTIPNAAKLKAKTSIDSATGIKTTTYVGAVLKLAPNVGSALDSLLGLPSGSLPDGATFGMADITIYSKA